MSTARDQTWSPTEPPLLGRVAPYRRWIEAGAVAGVTILALLALRSLLHQVHLRDISAALHALPFWRIAAAALLTAFSYFILTLYDVLALRVIGKPLPYRTAALASLASYTLSHNLGFALITGGSARYRVYTAAGLAPADIFRIILVASVTFWSGVFGLTGLALMLRAAPLHLGPFLVSAAALRGVGAIILALLAAAIGLVVTRRNKLAIRGWSVPIPTARQALAQPLLAALDIAAASAALFVLVPGAQAAHFAPFFLAYALAITAALATHVPGGIGVFEAVIIAAAPASNAAPLLAALILYRLIYYIAPLIAACALLAVHERRRLRQSPVGQAAAVTRDAVSLIMRSVAPRFLAAMAFIGGAVLLVTGSLPAVPARLHVLRHIMPLPFVEASHIAASLAGLGLLVLAPGLYRRLDAAFLLTRALLLAGAVFALARGFDYEEAVTLIGMAAVLQIARPAFYRRTALTASLGSPGALAAVAICLIFATWIGFFAYRHVDYQTDLWWDFAWNGNASRFLRATFAIAVALVCGGVIRLFGHAQPPPPDRAPDAAANDRAIAQSSRTDAFLAYTGDKRFLRSASGDALLMYQVQGRSWIVMGDPVGPMAEWPALLWRLREMADAAQGRLMLYQIGVETMPIAVDLGLQLVKYGEEARITLADFSLGGPEHKGLRHAERRALRDGASFAVIAAADVPDLLPELAEVSCEWLKYKGESEKSFSMGRFDPDYLARFDCAVVRQDNRVVAFANVWRTANHAELSVDLMRHARDTPQGAMDYLFIELMQWGRRQGYRAFNLGLAPLSGIEARRLSPFWARIGNLLFRHGGAFYSFKGLRAYKEKFSPEWQPRYVAAPHGVGLARALIDLHILVGGGGGSAAVKWKQARSGQHPL